MKKDIIFAGVGGQGIVSAAAMVVAELDRLGYKCKQNEVHGMAQRGGSVVCHVRASGDEIYSDMIPKGSADVILATEPMEALRYIEYLSPNGTILSANIPHRNIEYPDVNELIEALRKKNSIIVDAESLVKELKSEKVVNIAMIGALSKYLNIEGLREGIMKDIEKRFQKKGDSAVKMNYRAFEFGEIAIV